MLFKETIQPLIDKKLKVKILKLGDFFLLYVFEGDGFHGAYYKIRNLIVREL